MPISALAVYCGSSGGFDPACKELARETGRTLARRGITVVYGGGRVGMMGAVADGALEAGGRVIGVIPTFLDTRELKHPDVQEMHVVSSMHERKMLMTEFSDGFIGLPGGFGTLDEIFEAVTWSQLAIHAKPVGFLNHGGYYTGILECLDGMVDRGFLRADDRGRLLSADSLDALLEKFAAWQPPDTLKFTLASP